MTRIFHITTNGGHSYTGQSREIMSEQFGALEQGRYRVAIEKVGTYENPSRYKFYFAVVLTAILDRVGERFRMVNPKTGEETSARSTADIHEAMKARFNPVILITPYGATTSGSTTTNLSDRDFINEYMEEIMAEFSQEPFNVEFRDIDDWRSECKAKKEHSIEKK